MNSVFLSSLKLPPSTAQVPVRTHLKQALATLAGPLGSSQEVLRLGTSSPACESSAALVPELLSTADAEGEFPSVS